MLGFAICGSFCNYTNILSILDSLKDTFPDIVPVFSFNARSLDTRFTEADNFYRKVKTLTGNEPITTIQQAEPIGPKNLFKLLLVCPCTGNTLSKIASGVSDTPVTMAVKSQLRSNGKVLIALSSNDALSGSFHSFATMFQRKNLFFVPMYQDDCTKKPYSLTFDKSKLIESINDAENGIQTQPIFTAPPNIKK